MQTNKTMQQKTHLPYFVLKLNIKVCYHFKKKNCMIKLTITPCVSSTVDEVIYSDPYGHIMSCGLDN